MHHKQNSPVWDFCIWHLTKILLPFVSVSAYRFTSINFEFCLHMRGCLCLVISYSIVFSSLRLFCCKYRKKLTFCFQLSNNTCNQIFFPIHLLLGIWINFTTGLLSAALQQIWQRGYFLGWTDLKSLWWDQKERLHDDMGILFLIIWDAFIRVILLRHVLYMI